MGIYFSVRFYGMPNQLCIPCVDICQDDKLPMYLAEPKNTSLDLFVHQTVVTRGKDGVFRVGGKLTDEHGLTNFQDLVVSTCDKLFADKMKLLKLTFTTGH